MEPIATALAVMSASCATVTALAILWGRRRLRAASAAPVTLFRDNPAQGIQSARLRSKREAARSRWFGHHPLRVSHVEVCGIPGLLILAAMLAALVGVGLIVCA